MSCGGGRKHALDLALLWLEGTSSYSSNMTPIVGTSICYGYGPPKAKNNSSKKQLPQWAGGVHFRDFSHLASLKSSFFSFHLSLSLLPFIPEEKNLTSAQVISIKMGAD